MISARFAAEHTIGESAEAVLHETRVPCRVAIGAGQGMQFCRETFEISQGNIRPAVAKSADVCRLVLSMRFIPANFVSAYT